MYIARDKDGELYLFECKPINSKGFFIAVKGNSMRLKDIDFPSVTYKNSPKKIKLKIL